MHEEDRSSAGIVIAMTIALLLLLVGGGAGFLGYRASLAAEAMERRRAEAMERAALEMTREMLAREPAVEGAGATTVAEEPPPDTDPAAEPGRAEEPPRR